MTRPQESLYWRLWSAALKANPQPGSQAANAYRHELTRTALGYDRSMLNLTNAELDKVLAAFRAVAQPDNLDAQLAAEEQPEKRLCFALRRYAAAMDHDDAWLLAIAKAMAREGRFKVWQSAIDSLPKFVLDKLMVAVKKDARREWPQKADLFDVVDEFLGASGLSGAEQNAIFREIFRVEKLPGVNQWSYEQLLAILGAAKQRLQEVSA